MENSANKMDDKPLGNEDGGCFIRGFQWLTLKLNLVEKNATPPNWKYILLVFVSLFASSCTLTFLFPFLPEMILHFGYSEYEKAKYGGMIASAIFAGRIFSSMFWGWLADRRGRKQVILICLLLTGLTSGLFGFSVNITMAIVLRFLCGLSNGIVGTAKAALYDASDDTNQALGMTMLSLAWGMGLVAGPLLGGVLATPCTKWPDFCDEDSLFARYPFLLPSLFPFITCILVFFVVLTKFDDVFPGSSKEKYEFELELNSQEDDKNEMGELHSKIHIAPKHNHLFVQRSFSNKDDNQLHPQEHSSMLSRSVVSLCPEAEMSISLGKVVLHRQESMDTHRKRILEMTTSEPDLPLTNGHQFDNILVENVNSIYSKSSSHIQNGQTVVPKDSNGTKEVAINLHYNGSLKSLNGRSDPILGLNGTHLEGLVSSQPKARLSIEDETKHHDAHRFTEKSLNNQPLLLRPIKNEENDENVCECCDSCFSMCCTNSSLHKLLRLKDVWSSIMLYSVLSFVTIGVDDIFPMFASTIQDYGGLGFSTNEIGIALGFATLPLLFLQVKLYPFLVSKLGIRKTYIVMVIVCMVGCQSTPVLRSLVNSPVWLWICLVLIQVPFKIAANCCFASTSIFINNSAPQELTGQANGLGMTTTAIGRSIAPIFAGFLFSWSVRHGQFIGAPFDIGFPFFILGTIYGLSLIECLFIDPKLDKQKK